MVVLDDETDVGLSLAEEGATVWLPPQAPSRRQPQDFRAQYERERARADAAEARCEELRQAEREARSRAGMLKWNLDKSRDKLKAVVEDVKEVRRAANNAPALQAEVTRLEKLLSQAGVEPRKRCTIMSLRMEVARLREAAPAAEARPRATPRRSWNPEETITSLRAENARLKKEARAAKDQAGTIKFLERQLDNHRSWLRGCHDQIERLKARHGEELHWLNKDIAWLRETLGRAADKRRDEIASVRKQFDRQLAAARRLVEAREGTIAWLRERNARMRAATLYIAPDTMGLARAWREQAGIDSGRLFRSVAKGGTLGKGLDASQVPRIFKAMAERAGLPPAVVEELSGHSARVGAAQDMVAAGFELPAIQQAGRWKSTAMVSRYGERLLARRSAAAQLARLQKRGA